MIEILNRIVNKAYHILYVRSSFYFFGFYNLLNARVRGITVGKGLKAIGRIHFFRAPGSKIEIGPNCEFRSTEVSNLIGLNRRCIISTNTSHASIKIGINCAFSGVTIGARERIEIGDNCMVGANVIITDNDWHALAPDERRSGKPKSRPTLIDANVFIGVNSIILKGSSIGENSIIGAGSVVSGSIPSNVIAAGNPCIVIKQL